MDSILNLVQKILKENQHNVYLTWITLYIVGDRVKSNALLDKNEALIKDEALEHRAKYGLRKKKLYRGILLPPDADASEHNLWKYNHVSWTEMEEVADAFSTINSVYGSIFPKDYIGHKFELEDYSDKFCWFSFHWAKHIIEDFGEMIRIWNQKEVLLGDFSITL